MLLYKQLRCTLSFDRRQPHEPRCGQANCISMMRILSMAGRPRACLLLMCGPIRAPSCSKLSTTAPAAKDRVLMGRSGSKQSRMCRQRRASLHAGRDHSKQPLHRNRQNNMFPGPCPEKAGHLVHMRHLAAVGDICFRRSTMV